MSNINTVQRLEQWNNKHKNRSVQIKVDDGYGASCWTVKLDGDIDLTVSETSFFTDGKPVAWPNYRSLKDEKTGKMRFFTCVEEEFDDWPGLERTILTALDAWEELTRI